MPELLDWVFAVFALMLALAAMWLASINMKNAKQELRFLKKMHELVSQLQSNYGELAKKADALEKENAQLREQVWVAENFEAKSGPKADLKKMQPLKVRP